jgi:hypothetical protein
VAPGVSFEFENPLDTEMASEWAQFLQQGHGSGGEDVDLCDPITSTNLPSHQKKHNNKTITPDEALALVLQKEEYSGTPAKWASVGSALEEALAISKASADEAMTITATGKAWTFAARIAKMIDQVMLLVNSDGLRIDHLAADDIVFMVERMFEAQNAFVAEGKHAMVDIGFHYTRQENLLSVSENGLLTMAERSEKGVTSTYNGSIYGDGVYTGNDPFSYRHFGEVGLLVARLHGTTAPAMYGVYPGQNSIDTTINDQGSRGTMVVLGASYQCIPLAHFSRALVSLDRESAAILLKECHCALQEVVDECFNHGMPTAIPDYILVQPALGSAQASPPIQFLSVLQDTQQQPFRLKAGRRRLFQNAAPPPDRTAGSNSPSTVTTLHYVMAAADSSSATSNKNRMPSGSMKISLYSEDQVSCQGTGTIIIVYCMAGLESSSPLSQPQHHHHTVAFLPQTIEGCTLLERLKTAFCQGCTFDSPSEENCKDQPHFAVKLMVPHKHSPYRTSFPDPDYFVECNKILDDLLLDDI